MSSNELKDKRRAFLLAEGRARKRIALNALRQGGLHMALYEQGVVMGMAMSAAMSSDLELFRELDGFCDELRGGLNALAGSPACPES
jgi:hypothetical protein